MANNGHGSGPGIRRTAEARLGDRERERLLEAAFARVIADQEFASQLQEPDAGEEDLGPRVAVDHLREHVEAASDEIWRIVQTQERDCVRDQAAWLRRRWRMWLVLAIRFAAPVAAVLLAALTVYWWIIEPVVDLPVGTFVASVTVLVSLAPLVVRFTESWLSSIRHVQHAAKAAMTRLGDDLYTQGVAPVVRGFFPHDEWALTMSVGAVPGLADLASERFEVSTGSIEEMRDLLTTLDGGAIGIAGPRGAGKSTLIDSVCAGRTESFPEGHLGVRVSAPVNYDARDFVVHLLSRTCEEVIDDPEGLAKLRDDAMRDLLSRDLRRRMWLFAFLAMVFGIAAIVSSLGDVVSAQDARTILLASIAAGLALAAGAQLLRQAASLQPTLPSKRPLISITPDVGGLIGAAATGLAVSIFDLGSILVRGSVDPVRERAVRLYQDTKLQQSYTSTWSGSIEMPLGASLGAEGSMSWAQVQLSLPELVEQLRSFLRGVAEQREAPVVIGIDELDKMRSSEEAQTFLNGIKSIFGVAGVYFLVSISQDAMSSFERRGLPFRDVFDSSFDEIVEARYLTFEETQRLLRRRVIGMPPSFHALCHCLSGAVPRDVIRVARSLVAELRASEELPVVATRLVRAELRAKCRATAIAVNARGRSEGCAAVLEQAAATEALATPDVGAAALFGMCRDFGRTDAARLERVTDADVAQRPLADLAAELNTFVRYCAVVLELFGTGVTVEALLQAADAGHFERLAEARQGFMLDYTVAWARLDRIPTSTSPSAAPVAA
ncbi:MAG TPA: hypothetical protein VKB03_01720 [Conexibacter sp.]|nr:hypothetical protein [Conexibacter sp.]